MLLKPAELVARQQTQTHAEMLTAGQRRVFVPNPGGGLEGITHPDPALLISDSPPPMESLTSVFCTLLAGCSLVPDGPVQAEHVFRALLSLKECFYCVHPTSVARPN